MLHCDNQLNCPWSLLHPHELRGQFLKFRSILSYKGIVRASSSSPKVPLLRNMVIVREFPYILNLWYECQAASDLLKAPLFFALSMFVCQGMINCKLTVPWNRPECLITMSGD